MEPLGDALPLVISSRRAGSRSATISSVTSLTVRIEIGEAEINASAEENAYQARTTSTY
jgi:hypothetical protein